MTWTTVLLVILGIPTVIFAAITVISLLATTAIPQWRAAQRRVNLVGKESTTYWEGICAVGTSNRLTKRALTLVYSSET